MKEAQSLILGTMIGAGMMFFLDPRQSGARRARVRDKSVRAVHELEHAAAIGARDLEHRVEGAVARIRGPGRPDADEHVIEERVRAAVGRHCSHPHAIRVKAKGQGLVELAGPILADDLHDLLHAVHRVRGVDAIDEDLEVHETADGVPALQGEVHHGRRRLLRVTPAEKLILGIGLGGIALGSLFSGRPLGFVAGTAAMLGIARSINARSGPLFPRSERPRPQEERPIEEAVAVNY